MKNQKTNLMINNMTSTTAIQAKEEIENYLISKILKDEFRVRGAIFRGSLPENGITIEIDGHFILTFAVFKDNLIQSRNGYNSIMFHTSKIGKIHNNIINAYVN